MSKMNELYEKIARDSDLQAKVSEVIKNAQKDGEVNQNDELIKLANNIGYDITLDEMIEFFKEKAEDTAGELSDAELDMVAGGKAGPKDIWEAIIIGGMSALAEIDNYGCAKLYSPMK